MFEPGGQAVVLVPVPGLPTMPQQIQLQPSNTLTTAPAQALYLPYNLVIKQETNDPGFNGQMIISENNHHQVMLQQSSYLVPVTSGVTVKSEPEMTLSGNGLLQSSIPVAVSGMLSAEGINLTEVKPESLPMQFTSVDPLQNALAISQQTNQIGLSQFIPEEKPASVTVPPPNGLNHETQSIEMAPPLQNTGVTQTAPKSEDSTLHENVSSPGIKSLSLQASVTDEPDITALTTLAIVCDNIGSGRDKQYVVKVELEEPVPSPPVRSSSKSLREKPRTKRNHHHNQHRKKLVSASSSPPQSPENETTSQAEMNPKSSETKRSKSKRKAAPEAFDAEQSKSVFLSSSQGSEPPPLKRGKTEKLKTSSEKKTSRELKVIGDITSRKMKNCNSSLTMPVEGIKQENDKRKLSQSPETVLSQLPSDVQPKVETAAALSPASTIPYGDDSNDSVDLSGRSMFKCSQCSKSYTSDRSLRLHIGLLHQESDKSPLSAIFSCTQCTKAYTSQKRLDLHRLLVHETPDQNSPYARHRSRRKRRSSRRMREAEEHLTVEKESLKMMRGSRDASDSGDDSTLHGCALCKKQYTSKSRLTLHIGLCHDLQNTAIVEKLCNTIRVHPSKHKEKPLHPDDPVSSINVTIKTESISENDDSCDQNKVHIKEEPVDTEYDTADNVTGTNQGKQHNCSQCGLVFLHLDLYQEHLPVHDNEKSLATHMKNKKNRCATIQRYYMCKSFNRYRPYECKLCQKDFAERRCFKNHVSNVHEIYDPGDKIFSCPHCEKHFIKRTFLERHLASHGESVATDQERCFKCADCNKTFTQKAHVQRHHRLMHLDVSLVRIFTCNLCGRSFKLKSHLQRHLKMHEGSLPFHCSICKFMCADRHALRCHMRCHTGEKPFKCPHCSKCFSMKNNMNSHIIDTHQDKLTESERRKNQCTICKKVMNKGAMKLHMRVHKNDRPYQCDICGKAFYLRHLLRDHCLTVHEGEKKYKCAKCQKCYTSKPQLKLHLAKKH